MKKEQNEQELPKYKEFENTIMKHTKNGRTIKVIAVNPFTDFEGQEQIFCSYYWNNFGLIGTDLIENIVANYKVIE